MSLLTLVRVLRGLSLLALGLAAPVAAQAQTAAGRPFLETPSADPVPPAIARALDEARAQCADQGGGFSIRPEAVVSLALDRAGSRRATLFDASRLACASAASLYCGSGGCPVMIEVEGRTWTFLAEGWMASPYGDATLLLLALHGDRCAAFGYQPCARALVWSEGAFLAYGGPVAPDP